MNLESRFRTFEINIVRTTKNTIDNSASRKIEERPNGDKFIHDNMTGYIVDGATGEIKFWHTREFIIGGSDYWMESEFKYNNVIGPEGIMGYILNLQ